MTVSDSGFLKRSKKWRFQHRHHHCRATAALCLKKKKNKEDLFTFDRASNAALSFLRQTNERFADLHFVRFKIMVFITVLIKLCFRAPRCRSICNTLTVISFLSSTQRNHPWWNFSQPSGILLQTCLSSSYPTEPQCNPTSTHCEIMATPQPPTPIRVNKT